MPLGANPEREVRVTSPSNQCRVRVTKNFFELNADLVKSSQNRVTNCRNILSHWVASASQCRVK